MKIQLVLLFLFSVLCTSLFGQEPTFIERSDQPTLTGVLEPVESLRLATRDSGILTELTVKAGDTVTAGTTIAVLDSELYQAEYQAAQRELDIANEEAKNDVDLQYAKISTEVNGQVLKSLETSESSILENSHWLGNRTLAIGVRTLTSLW